MLLGLVGRRLNLRDLVGAIESTVVVSGLLFVIVMGANLFSFFIVQTHLPPLLLDGANALALSGLMVMLVDHRRLHPARLFPRGHRHGADHRAGVSR